MRARCRVRGATGGRRCGDAQNGESHTDLDDAESIAVPCGHERIVPGMWARRKWSRQCRGVRERPIMLRVITSDRTRSALQCGPTATSRNREAGLALLG